MSAASGKSNGGGVDKPATTASGEAPTASTESGYSESIQAQQPAGGTKINTSASNSSGGDQVGTVTSPTSHSPHETRESRQERFRHAGRLFVNRGAGGPSLATASVSPAAYSAIVETAEESKTEFSPEPAPAAPSANIKNGKFFFLLPFRFI